MKKIGKERTTKNEKQKVKYQLQLLFPLLLLFAYWDCFCLQMEV